MKLRRSQLVVVLLAMLLAAACAKRPAMTQTAAPPPTGAAVTTAPPAPPAPAAPIVPPAAPVVPPAAVAPATPPPVIAAPPAPAPRPAPAEFKSIPELRGVFFDFDKSTIRTDAARTLDTNIAWLKSNPAALILIEGHCDERGTNAYNLVLGERRAKATQDYLVARGVAAARITIISYGEERPACAARNEACWAQNRRAHFLTKQP
jgi:peptidoglycan-associated lipoprotein